jgi:threonine dehydratase
MRAIEFNDIKEAQEKLSGVALKTLFERSRSATNYLGTETFLKFENQQRTGSFKIRGAYNKISNLTKEELNKGVSACSAGNHAQGVAYSAQALGAKAHIVMPIEAPVAKVQATLDYGAEVYQHGVVVDEAKDYCLEMSEKEGYTFVHPYEDPLVIAGQGTIGLELYDSIQDLDSVVVSVGGGGLISGVALAMKSLNPKIKIYGAVAENAPGMKEVFDKSKNFTDGAFASRPTIADGIAIRRPSKYIYDNYISKYVDDLVTVNDEEIALAMVYLLERAKAVVEGAGAAGLAGAKKANWDLGKKCAVILCGGNVDLNLISRVIEKGLTTQGRMTRIEVLIEDIPGQLNRLTEVLSQLSANVIDVQHNRVSHHLGLRQTMVEFLLMTRSREHIEEIKKAFTKTGAVVKESLDEL